jgi:hypothetical protein
MLSRLLKTMMVSGDERIVPNSGSDCAKGTMKFRGSQPLQLDSFLQHDLKAPALLPVYSTASGMASIDDTRWNSGEIFRLIAGSGVG